MNHGLYGITSLICSVYNRLPESISKEDFDDILLGKGGIQTEETCNRKWKMMIDSGWFVPSGDDICRIDQNTLTDTMVRYKVDIVYDGDGGYQNESLLRNLLGRSIDVDRIVHYDR